MAKICTKYIQHKCVSWEETDEGLVMTAKSCPVELKKILLESASKGIKIKITDDDKSKSNK